MKTYSFQEAIDELFRLAELQVDKPIHYATSIRYPNEILHSFWLMDTNIHNPIRGTYNSERKEFYHKTTLNDLKDIYVIKVFRNSCMRLA